MARRPGQRARSTARITIRLTERERELLRRWATELRTSPAEVLRGAIHSWAIGVRAAVPGSEARKERTP